MPLGEQPSIWMIFMSYSRRITYRITYRADFALRVYIEKPDGRLRPLGIPTML